MNNLSHIQVLSGINLLGILVAFKVIEFQELRRVREILWLKEDYPVED